MILARSKALKAQISEVLGAAVHVTLDAVTIPQLAPRGAVFIEPPKLAFPTYHEVDVTHDVNLIAGPPGDPLAALAVIDQMLDKLQLAGLNISKATPATYKPKLGEPLACYTLTLNPE